MTCDWMLLYWNRPSKQFLIFWHWQAIAPMWNLMITHSYHLLYRSVGKPLLMWARERIIDLIWYNRSNTIHTYITSLNLWGSLLSTTTRTLLSCRMAHIHSCRCAAFFLAERWGRSGFGCYTNSHNFSLNHWHWTLTWLQSHDITLS